MADSGGMAMKTWITRLLLAFVFVTIGFALGRQTAPSAHSSSDESAVESMQPGTNGNKVVVYSVHMTFRCWECNQIEFLTKELLDAEFAEPMAAGTIEYRSVDYLKDTEFARRYNIASSTLVVVRFEDGQEAEFQRLDEVWTKARDRDAFIAYVREAIRSQLAQIDEEVA